MMKIHCKFGQLNGNKSTEQKSSWKIIKSTTKMLLLK